MKMRTLSLPKHCIRTYIEMPEGNRIVSTVKLPEAVMQFDAAWGDGHDDQRHETAVFPANKDWDSDYGNVILCKRFKTWKEAVAFHKKLVKKVENEGII